MNLLFSSSLTTKANGDPDARAYYMHHILHDWPDNQARRILEMQKTAMKPGYSKILVHDQIMKDDRLAHPHAAAFDIGMMAFGSA